MKTHSRMTIVLVSIATCLLAESSAFSSIIAIHSTISVTAFAQAGSNTDFDTMAAAGFNNHVYSTAGASTLPSPHVSFAHADFDSFMDQTGSLAPLFMPSLGFIGYLQAECAGEYILEPGYALATVNYEAWIAFDTTTMARLALSVQDYSSRAHVEIVDSHGTTVFTSDDLSFDLSSFVFSAGAYRVSVSAQMEDVGWGDSHSAINAWFAIGSPDGVNLIPEPSAFLTWVGMVLAGLLVRPRRWN